MIAKAVPFLTTPENRGLRRRLHDTQESATTNVNSFSRSALCKRSRCVENCLLAALRLLRGSNDIPNWEIGSASPLVLSAPPDVSVAPQLHVYCVMLTIRPEWRRPLDHVDLICNGAIALEYLVGRSSPPRDAKNLPQIPQQTQPSSRYFVWCFEIIPLRNPYPPLVSAHTAHC